MEYLYKVGEASPIEIAESLQINRSTVQRNVKNLFEFVEWTGNSIKDPFGKYKIITSGERSSK